MSTRHNGWSRGLIPAALTLSAGMLATGPSVAGKYMDVPMDDPQGLKDVKAISAGYDHNLALKKDGTVFAWGLNSVGESTVPQGLRDAVAISAGYGFSLALKGDGTVVSWGWDSEGQVDVPKGLKEVVAIAAGTFNSLALQKDGTVVEWGSQQRGPISVPRGLSHVAAIAAGYGCFLALKHDGTVVAWGERSSNHLLVPKGLVDVAAIALSGDSYAMALKRDGTVVTWGQVVNEGNSGSSPPPVAPGWRDISAISAGGCQMLALTRDGTVLADGGDPRFWPSGLTGVIAISAGPRHGLALKEDGTVVVWNIPRRPPLSLEDRVRTFFSCRCIGESILLGGLIVILLYGAVRCLFTHPSQRIQKLPDRRGA